MWDEVKYQTGFGSEFASEDSRAPGLWLELVSMRSTNLRRILFQVVIKFPTTSKRFSSSISKYTSKMPVRPLRGANFRHGFYGSPFQKCKNVGLPNASICQAQAIWARSRAWGLHARLERRVPGPKSKKMAAFQNAARWRKGRLCSRLESCFWRWRSKMQTWNCNLCLHL